MDILIFLITWFVMSLIAGITGVMTVKYGTKEQISINENKIGKIIVGIFTILMIIITILSLFFKGNVFVPIFKECIIIYFSVITSFLLARKIYKHRILTKKQLKNV